MLFVGAGRLFALRYGGDGEASLIVKLLIFALFISKRQQAVFASSFFYSGSLREQQEHGRIF